jgi:hypothetical protein
MARIVALNAVFQNSIVAAAEPSLGEVELHSAQPGLEAARSLPYCPLSRSNPAPNVPSPDHVPQADFPSTKATGLTFE